VHQVGNQPRFTKTSLIFTLLRNGRTDGHPTAVSCVETSSQTPHFFEANAG